MNGAWGYAIRSLARLLDPGEKEVALGDVAELGHTGRRAFTGLLGLVVRRQLQPWRQARAWLSLLVLVLPVATLLGIFSNGLGMRLFPVVMMWSHHRVVYATGLTWAAELSGWLFEAAAMTVASWSLGLAVGVFSRATRYVDGLLFCIGLMAALSVAPGSFSMSALGLLPLTIAMMLVVLPAFCGVGLGAADFTIGMPGVVFLTAGIGILSVLHAWVWGWYGAAMENWSHARSALGLGQLLRSGMAWGAVIPSLFSIFVMTLPGLCLLVRESRRGDGETA